jgi:flagellar hook-associated protein 2
VSQGMFSIGGLASGLDTANIVQSLLQLERRPMVALQQRQADYRKANDAWGQIVTRLSSLRTATDRLTDPSWAAKTVAGSSTNDAVARVSNVTGAQTGRMAFEVTQLASSHQVRLGSFTGADALVGQGTVTVAHGGGSWSVELTEGATVADAARALNRLEGVSAQVLRIDDQTTTILVTSSRSGAGGAMTFGGDVAGLDAVELRAAQDAKLTIGGLELSRSSNTVTDLYQGVELRLAGIGAVEIEVRQDLEAATGQVKGFVDGLNNLLNQLSTASRSSAEASSRGPLAGDPLARQFALQLRGALSQVTADGGEFSTLSQIGISLTRQGSVTLDESKLRQALAADPAAVASLLGKASSSTNPAMEVTAAGRAQPGAYQVQIDKAAQIAARTGAGFTPPTGSPKTFSLTVGGKTVSVTVDEDEDVTQAVQRINAALQAEGVATLVAKVDDGQLRLEATRAGAAGSFSTDGLADWGFDDGVTVEGVGAEGSVTGAAGTWTFASTGQSVVLGAGAAQGLSFRVPVGVTGDAGTINVGDGLGSVIDRILRTAEGRDGSIARAREALDGRIRAADRSIEAFEQRLEIRERSIRRQFTAMESSMAQFSAQANWLASQIGAMFK